MTGLDAGLEEGDDDERVDRPTWERAVEPPMTGRDGAISASEGRQARALRDARDSRDRAGVLSGTMS